MRLGVLTLLVLYLSAPLTKPVEIQSNIFLLLSFTYPVNFLKIALCLHVLI